MHVTHHDLGCEAVSHVRGSPYDVRAKDPWTRHRVLGAAPSQRKAPSLVPLAGQLVLFGGDKSGPYTLNTAAADWRWAPLPVPSGPPMPSDRTLHGAALYGDRKLVVFAGVSLADQSELADVWVLQVRLPHWLAAELYPLVNVHAVRSLVEPSSCFSCAAVPLACQWDSDALAAPMTQSVHSYGCISCSVVPTGLGAGVVVLKASRLPAHLCTRSFWRLPNHQRQSLCLWTALLTSL